MREIGAIAILYLQNVYHQLLMKSQSRNQKPRRHRL